MPRRPRIYHPGGIYHVILRGNARQPIFFSLEHRERLNALVAEGLARYECRLYAFCWMTNHIHTAIRISEQPLSALMRWLGTEYARFLNRERNRSGHVFERRHRALLVADDSYLLGLIKYIHLNPVRAGLVARPESYPWSSHRCYLGHESLAWLSTASILARFARDKNKARAAFVRFMDEEDTASGSEAEVIFEGRKPGDQIIGNLDSADQLGSKGDKSSRPTTLEKAPPKSMGRVTA